MKSVTVHTFYKSPSNDREPRQVSLWINPDKTVTLLGNLNHGTQIIVDQELVNALQKVVDATK